MELGIDFANGERSHFHYIDSEIITVAVLYN
jgi:hypothetical protein